jgi:hypothetical protein
MYNLVNFDWRSLNVWLKIWITVSLAADFCKYHYDKLLFFLISLKNEFLHMESKPKECLMVISVRI